MGARTFFLKLMGSQETHGTLTNGATAHFFSKFIAVVADRNLGTSQK